MRSKTMLVIFFLCAGLAATVLLSLSFAAWEKKVEDRQELLAGKSVKAVPIQPDNSAFVQEAK